MNISQEDLKRFSDILAENIKYEFKEKKINKNMINIIRVVQTDKGFAVEVESKPYNNSLARSGVIVYNGLAGYKKSRKTSKPINTDTYDNYVTREIVHCIKLAQEQWSLEKGITTKRR